MILERARRVLREDVAPLAEAMDSDPGALRVGLDALCRERLMALRCPAQFGGPEVSESDFREFQECVARTSGALAFLQTQHQSAVGLIAKGSNMALKEEWLPQMHDGTRLVAIGFSQLRRPGPPLLRAVPTEEGYLLHGHLPWATGWGFFPELLVGAQLPDGRAVFGLVPFRLMPRIEYHAPMRLLAMEAAQTVAADFSGFLLVDKLVVDIKPAGWILRNDQINITLQGFFAIGCARGSLDHIRTRADRLHPFADALEEEIEDCRDRLLRAQGQSEETTAEKLALRAWAIDLAVRCAHAAIAASGGAANLVGHPAQRLYCEALVYTVSAQTEAIQSATLARLAQPRPSVLP